MAFDYQRIPSYITDQLFAFQDVNRLKNNLRHLAEDVLGLSEGTNTAISVLKLGNPSSILHGSIDLETGTGSPETIFLRDNAPFGNCFRSQATIQWRMLGQTKAFGQKVLACFHDRLNSIAGQNIFNLTPNGSKVSVIGLFATTITSVASGGSTTSFLSITNTGIIQTTPIAVGAVNTIIRHKVSAARLAYVVSGVAGTNLISFQNLTTGAGNVHYLTGGVVYCMED